MIRPRRRGAAALVCTLLLSATTVACSSDDDPKAEPTSSPSATVTEPPPVETVVSIGEVTGRLPRAGKVDVKAEVGTVVDGWLDAAYLDGDYPRRDFSDSWPGFTKGAHVEARRDRDLMSNADIGPRIDSVEAKKRTVRVDVLAARRKPAGVTAHVVLRFNTTGKVTARIRVQGRLYLTPSGGSWRIFGYDITKEKLR